MYINILQYMYYTGILRIVHVPMLKSRNHYTADTVKV